MSEYSREYAESFHELASSSTSSTSSDTESCSSFGSLMKNLKIGSSGRKIPLLTNYFKLDKLPNFLFQQYHVSFEPEIDLDRLRKYFVYSHASVLAGCIYDGKSVLYSTKDFAEETIKLECKDREGKTYTLIVKKTKKKLTLTGAEGSRILNVILRKAMNGLELLLIRQNLFDPHNSIKLNEYGIELWPGYVTSIRHHESDILLCCEISHKVLRQEMIYDILKRCSRERSSDYKTLFSAEVIGSIVLTRYNNKTYRIDDIDWNINPGSTFPYKGRDISFIEYYKEKYHIDIKDPKQPLLISKPKVRDIRGSRIDTVCLIPELCCATGLTERMKNDFQLMKAMADYTRMNPQVRVKRLLDFNNRLRSTSRSADVFDKSQVKLQPELLKLEGRILPQETILFGNGKSAKVDEGNVDWTNPMKINQMYHNEALTKWAIIYPESAAIDTQNFLKLLFEVGQGMRYEMKDPKMISIPNDRVGTYTKELETILQRDPKFVMIVLPNQSADRYAAVKKMSCVDNSIPTQIVVHKTMKPKKGSMSGVKSIATKVLIQMNSKLGGSPWHVSIPLKGLMTVGFDVSRDTTDKGKSYGAFIATMDLKKSVKYFSAVAVHKQGEEISGNIDVHMRNALHAYLNLHGALPEKILMYRDGVGEGDLELVRNQEVNQLETTLRDVYEAARCEYKPQFCFIVVTKRINTRFFTDNKFSNKCDNPCSGTVVDNTVTLPDRYDFYLISQSVRQGTVSPTSYNVLLDTIKLPADKLQILTYKMCHMYFNWSSTTRVPNVLQYAQKLGVLVSQYLHHIPSSRFSENGQLYFL